MSLLCGLPSHAEDAAADSAAIEGGGENQRRRYHTVPVPVPNQSVTLSYYNCKYHGTKPEASESWWRVLARLQRGSDPAPTGSADACGTATKSQSVEPSDRLWAEAPWEPCQTNKTLD